MRGICEDPDLETVSLKTYREPRRMRRDVGGDMDDGEGSEEVGLEDVSHVLNRNKIRRVGSG